MDGLGYTLQFGVFALQESAVKASHRFGLAGGPLAIGPINAAGKTVYVLLFGNFSSYEDAVYLGERFKRQYKDADYWVRPMASVRANAQ